MDSSLKETPDNSIEKDNSLHFKKNVKKAFNQFSELQMVEGIKSLGKTGGRTIAAGFSFVKAYSIIEIINNDKLSWDKKILPVLGYTLGAVAMGTVAIVAIAGASTLLPPFIFAAHCVGVFHQFTNYLEAKTERDVLRKELITSNQFQKFILKKVSSENQPTVLKYAYLPQEIYKEFYALRNQINALTIPLEDKEKLIVSLYKNMEDFGQGKTSQITLDVSHLPQAIQQKTTQLSLLLEQYELSKNAINTLSLSKSTRKQIDMFKITREKIWCQDLPVPIKEQLTALVNTKKNKKRKIADLYLRIGNDYLNRNPVSQLVEQNEQINKLLNTHGFSEQDKSVVMAYLKEPRDIYDSLVQFKTILEDTAKGNMITHYLNFPTPETAKEIVTYLNNLNDPSIEASHAFETLRTQTEKYKQTSEKYEALKAQIHPNQGKLIQSIDNHHFQGLNQHTQTSQRFFGSPNILIPVNQYNYVTKSKKGVKNFAKQQYSAFTKQAKNDSNLSTLVVNNERKNAKSSLKKEFKDSNQYTFELIAAGEKLAYLEKATPRFLGNTFISAGVAVLSLASTFVLPAIATPAAPAGAAAGAVLTVGIVALTGASIANSADLMRIKFKQYKKVKTSKDDIAGAITPNVDLDLEKKLMKKLNTTLNSKNENTPIKSTFEQDQNPEMPVKLSNGNKENSLREKKVEKEEKEREKEGEKSGETRRDSRKY